MAHSPKKDNRDQSRVDWAAWTPPFTVLGGALAVLAITIVLFLHLNSRLGSIETSLAALTTRLQPIFNQWEQPFKKVAQEKGYARNVSLFPVSLGSTTTGLQAGMIPAWFIIAGTVGDLNYEFKYELMKATNTTLEFILNGKIGTVQVKNIAIEVPLKLNEPVPLSTFIGVPGLPRFYIEVIALPSTETGDAAVLAVGEKKPIGV